MMKITCDKKYQECLHTLWQKVRWVPSALTRLAVGSVFLESGWGKLHHLDKVIGFFQELGIPAAHLQAPFVAGVEFVCGGLVLLGLFTRLASVPLIATMAVALITAKRQEITSFTDLFGLSEFLFIVLFIWLVVNGAGCLSLDHFIGKRWCNTENK